MTLLCSLEAKVSKFRKLYKNPKDISNVEGTSKNEEVYHEMIRDARLDYEVVVLQLKKCTLTYEHLRFKQTWLRRQFNDLLLQIAYMMRDKVGVSLKSKPIYRMMDLKIDDIVLTPFK